MSDVTTDDLMAGLDDLDDLAPAPSKKLTPTKKRAAALTADKLAAARALVEAADADEASKPVPESRDSRLPGQGPKSTWPVIVIDEEEGQPNFQFVQVNDVAFQIKRGVETPVPPAVLSLLNNARASRLVQSRDPVSGGVRNSSVSYSGVPYRIVAWGNKK